MKGRIPWNKGKKASKETGTLATATNGAKLFVANDKVYLIGGQNDDDLIQSASIN